MRITAWLQLEPILARVPVADPDRRVIAAIYQQATED